MLHTWGQNLLHHPHLHCVIPGGGFAENGTEWIRCREDFFLPVHVLSRVFRGKFIDFLKEEFRKGRLKFHGLLAAINQPDAFERQLNVAVRNNWVVYAKPPFGGPTQVLKYLARYTHRVAISNDRLIACANGQVQFRYKDYADDSAVKSMTVSACEFIRRFLLHTLPRGFMKIRQFGYLANRVRREKLEKARRLLGEPLATPTQDQLDHPAPMDAKKSAEITCCPSCGQGEMVCTERLLPCRDLPTWTFPTLPIPFCDSS